MINVEYYISKKDFKVHKELDDFIPCDFEIAEAIASLNANGYETFACCAGHYNPGFYLYQNVDLDELEDCKNDPHMIVIDERGDGFDVWSERLTAHIYVAFKKKYDFESLPEGFVLKDFESASGYDGLTLDCDVNYYDEQGKMRSMGDVVEELTKQQNALCDWVKKLPKNIEKGKVK